MSQGSGPAQSPAAESPDIPPVRYFQIHFEYLQQAFQEMTEVLRQANRRLDLLEQLLSARQQPGKPGIAHPRKKMRHSPHHTE